MRRLLSVVAAIVMVASTFGLSNVMPAAHGDLAWCLSDPVVQIDGHSVDVTVAMWLSGAGHVNTQVPLAIVVPDGISHSPNQVVPGEFFNDDVRFFTVSQAAEAAAFLGVPAIGSLNLSHASNNHVYVFSIISGDHGIGTRLYTGNFAHLTTRETNVLMSISFRLGGK